MTTKSYLALNIFLLGAMVLCVPQNASPQDQDQYPQDRQYQQQDQQDPPSRVARLDDAEGSVSYQPSGDRDWVQADLNRPLTTGDNLWADQGSRAELHIGSTSLRMGDQTGISFLNLNDQAVQIQLAQGSLEVDLRHLHSGETYEIDTPNLAFSLVRPGEYMVTTDPNGNSTVISVYEGEGSVWGGGRTFNVTPGQEAVFTGNNNQLSEDVRRIGRSDSFYSWARSREMREEHSVSSRYVSPDVTGYSDLDDYGTWRSDPTYGNYWEPNDVSSDWAPYHEGHWVWVAPWGWTWDDDERWGFAPFHYGRWAMFGDRWGWIPGPVAVVPVYAPALVGFVGGGGFGVSIAIGSEEGVGWFPLGPRDVYVPAYRVSPQYVEEVNVSNTRVVNRTEITNVYNNYTTNNITNVNYMYADNTRAVTVVNRNAFVSGQPVQRSMVRVNPEVIQHPRVVTTAALTPTRTSVIGAAAAPARAKPPATLANRPLVTKLKPAPQAAPLGRPRPAANPNLSPAVLNRSGYSPQLQTIRATAAARAPAHAAAPANQPAAAPNRPGAAPANRPGTPPNAARPNEPANRPGAAPNQPRPNETPNRPFTPPNRPATNPNQPRPNEVPNRPATNPNQPRPNETPNRPFTPPNRPATNPNQPRPNEIPNRPATNPNQPRPNETPNRPFTPPNRPATNPNQPRPNEVPNRPATNPNQPRPSETPNRPFTPPNRPATNPNQPRPETQPRTMTPPERQPERPTTQPRPEPTPRTAPAPERQPERPATQPRPEPPPRTAPAPERQPARPAEQPRPQANPRTPPPERAAPAERPRQAPPPKEEKPKPKPQPQPQPV